MNCLFFLIFFFHIRKIFRLCCVCLSVWIYACIACQLRAMFVVAIFLFFFAFLFCSLSYLFDKIVEEKPKTLKQWKEIKTFQLLHDKICSFFSLKRSQCFLLFFNDNNFYTAGIFINERMSVMRLRACLIYFYGWLFLLLLQFNITPLVFSFCVWTCDSTFYSAINICVWVFLSFFVYFMNLLKKVSNIKIK